MQWQPTLMVIITYFHDYLGCYASDSNRVAVVFVLVMIETTRWIICFSASHDQSQSWSA